MMPLRTMTFRSNQEYVFSERNTRQVALGWHTVAPYAYLLSAPTIVEFGDFRCSFLYTRINRTFVDAEAAELLHQAFLVSNHQFSDIQRT